MDIIYNVRTKTLTLEFVGSMTLLGSSSLQDSREGDQICTTKEHNIVCKVLQ